jgi:hypothetical protein
LGGEVPREQRQSGEFGEKRPQKINGYKVLGKNSLRSGAGNCIRESSELLGGSGDLRLGS